MSIVGMIAAFAVLSGVALFWNRLVKVNIGEGMILAAASAVVLLYVGGLGRNFEAGLAGMFVLAAAGYLSGIYGLAKGKKDTFACFYNPYYGMMCLALLYTLAAYYHDFIQHIDEFHQWAANVKFMLEQGCLVTESPLLHNANPFGTSLYHLFYQKMTGYSEQNLYASSFLLMYTGFLLPFSECKMQDWKKVGLYSLILYVSLFSLYHYSSKNLYVDLAVASWAAGLAGWWMNRTKRKANLLIVPVMLLMLVFFKYQVGPLMAVCVFLFILMHTLLVEKERLKDAKFRRRMVIAVCAAAVFCLLFVRGCTLPMLSAPDLKKKAVRTLGAFLSSLFGRPLASRSDLKIAFVPFIAAILVLLKVTADLFRRRREGGFYMVYAAVIALGYSAVLFWAYLFIFSYEESLVAAGMQRYMAICAIYLFVLALVWLLQEGKAALPKVPGYFSLGILLLFLSGLNQKFIPATTAFDKQNSTGYEDISGAKKQIEEITEVIAREDRVYLLEQESETEFVRNAAVYYLGEQVSNYLTEPWKFTESGSTIRLADRERPSVEDFPEILSEGDYTYLWIFCIDEYLEKMLPKVLNCRKVQAPALYRVVREEGRAVELEYVKGL